MTADDPDTTDVTVAAVSVWDDCATGSSASNALVGEPPDAYLRSSSTINQTCGCKQWQIDKHAQGESFANTHDPDCRPTSIADFSLHVQQEGYRLGAEVPTWNVAGPLECENSTLNVKVQQWDGTQYNTLWASGDRHPVWSNGSCLSLQAFDNGPDFNVPGPLRVRAVATRGLDTSNNGFEGVRLRAFVF